MKRFLLLCVAVASIAFVGCSDDKEEQKNDELVGTTWVFSQTDLDYSSYETIRFESGAKCVYTLIEKESGTTVTNIKATGKYSYTPPIVKIRISYEGEEATKQLKITGNTMSDENGYTFTLQE